MKVRFRVTSIVCSTFVCALLASAPICQAPLCRAESAAHVAKRVRKVQKKLAKYRPGTYLRIVFRDHSETLGTVGMLKVTTFTFTNADTNATQAYSYSDVAHVQKSKTYVGEGSVRRHRPRLLIPAIAGLAAAGAVAAMLGTQ